MGIGLGKVRHAFGLELGRGLLDVYGAEGRFTKRAEGLADQITLARALGNRRVLLDLLTLSGMVLTDVGRPTRLEGPDPALLQAAYAEVSRD